MKKRSIKIKVKSLKKALSFLFVIAAFVVVVSIFMPSNKVGGKNEDATYSYSVSNGDTLWSIAEKITPGNKDIRETVYEIRQLNEFSKDHVIGIGEIIVLPK